MLLGPGCWRNPPAHRPYATDNDCFVNRDDPAWWEREGEAAWLKMLDRIPTAHPPLFVLLPDVVGDWTETLNRAVRYAEEVRRRRLRVGIALQNGCDSEREYDDCLRREPDAVFVGGTRAWKWAHAPYICKWFGERGVWVHVGRVSGPAAVQRCLQMGSDSCDGTGWSKFTDQELPKLLRVLKARAVTVPLDIDLRGLVEHVPDRAERPQGWSRKRTA